MSMIIDGTNGLTFNNATTQASAGQVLQVAQGIVTTGFSSTSTSFVTTGVTATITPKFSTSKVLISYTFGGACTNSFQTQIYKGGSTLSGTTGTTGANVSTSLFIPQNSGSSGFYNVCSNYLDSPATTSATTYAIYIKTDGGTFYFNTRSGTDFSGIATITLMEIAA